MSEKIKLFLDGGGFTCVKARGIVKSLEKRGKIPEEIQGVSGGAINAAKLVESGFSSGEFDAGWLNMAAGHHHDIFKLDWYELLFHPKRWLAGNSIYTDEGLLKLLGSLDPQKIVDSPIKLEVAVHNETDGRMEIMSNRDEIFRADPPLILKAIKASASLTGFFPPVEINGKYYSDGYYFHLEHTSGFDTVFVVVNDDPAPSISPFSNKFRRVFAGAGRVLDDVTKNQIEQFLEHHRDEFSEFKVSSKDNVVLRLRNTFMRGMDKVLGKGRFVVITPNYSLPDLSTDKFKKTTYDKKGVVEKLGSLEMAMDLSYQQSEELMKEVYPE
ncbi:MAG: patatin-like phospholipase family protein [bacterium]|nr:patatin-like phospholipase family protein [bacterium]